MRKKFRELLDEGIIIKLSEIEKEDYCSFLNYTWKDNLEACKANLKKFPRWSIIAGYYAMHDLAKLFIAKNFNLKITQRVHFATIVALENVFKKEGLRKKIISLLKEAEKYYEEVEPSIYLKLAKREREKVQYYTDRKLDFDNYQHKASYFLNYIVSPFVEMLEKLI